MNKKIPFSLAISIVIVLTAILVGGIFVYQHLQLSEKEPEVSKQMKEEILISPDRQKIINKVNGETILDVEGVPYSMKISPGIEFGEPERTIMYAVLSFDGKWIAIALDDAAHAYGWLYNLETKKFSPIAFSYDGSIPISKWREDSRFLAFEVVTAASSYINIIDVQNLPEYPDDALTIKAPEESGFKPYVHYIITGWKDNNICFQLGYDKFCFNPETKEITPDGKEQNFIATPPPGGQNSKGIYYFYNPKYQNYKEVDQYIEDNGIAEKINIVKYDVSNKENEKLWREIADECRKMAGVPSIWDGEKCYDGFNDIINYLNKYAAGQPITTVEPSVKPQIIITSPKVGDRWVPSFSYDVAWETQGILSDAAIYLKLSYMRTGELSPRESSIFPTGTTNVKNAGLYRWYIPTDAFTVSGPWYKNYNDKYRIRAIYYDPNTYEVKADDYSDYFSINTTSAVVDSPNGGEVWEVGETRNIIWETQNIPQSAKVQISLYSMQSSTLIVDATNIGSYAWTIPNILQDIAPLGGDFYKVAIFVTDSTTGRTYSDESDRNFSILGE